MIDIPGYRILHSLGRGRHSTVYLAEREVDGREVALKVLSRELTMDEAFAPRFEAAMRAAAALEHPHIASLFGTGRFGERCFVAMEALTGGAVLPRSGKPLRPERALAIVRDAASALAHAHRQGEAHGDLRAESLLLRADGKPVLTGFGTAEAITGKRPDVERSGRVDLQARRNDAFRLGVALYRMLVGDAALEGNDDPDAAARSELGQRTPRLPAAAMVAQPVLERLLGEERCDDLEEVARLAETTRAGLEAPQSAAATRSAVTAAPAAPAREAVAFPAKPPGRHRDDGWGAALGNAHGRAEPGLGRIDDIASSLDEQAIRAAHRREPIRAKRRGGRGALVAAVLLGVLAVGAWAVWSNQDRLRRLLPRTEFNDTLGRAKRALDEGRLTGTQGDSARELYQAARAQDPDNDTARAGLQEVGQRLLARAREAQAKDDLVAAQSALDEARALLGGGEEIDRLERALKERPVAEDRELSAPLDAAAAALAAGRLTGADGAAALYQRVLARDKGNAIAQAGLRKVADALAMQARSAIEARNADDAAARTDEVTRIAPNHPALPELRARITQLREGARATLEATLDRAEERIRAGDFSGTPDSALELFRSVQKIDPGNRRLKPGFGAIAQALVVRANAAIDVEDAALAKTLLDSAAELAADLPDLRAARIGLRELEERQAIAAEQANVTPARRSDAERLVAEAEHAVGAGELIVPPGRSAYDKYRAALAADPANADARRGIERLPSRARVLFERALTDGAPLRARIMLDAVRQIAPEDASIVAMERKLLSAFLDLADARLGEGRRDDAARLIDAARELDRTEPRIGILEARLRDMRPGGG